MTVYSVYQPPSMAEDVESRAEGLVFVKEGFSWAALLVPAIWLLYKRMWIEFAVFVAVLVLLGWLTGSSEAGKTLFSSLSLGLFVLLAFEANDLYGDALERRGYRLAGVASGKSRDEAELQFFRAWLPEQRRTARRESGPAPWPAPQAAPSRSGDGEGVIGLFPQA